MCMSAPKPPPVVEPIQYSIPKMPQDAQLQRMMRDRLARGRAATQITPATGLGAPDNSGKKNILG